MGRILITDDEAPVRALMAAILRQSGHDVIEARSAREALELHRQDPADLIVTDMLMQEMDGTELLRRVRASSPHTPVVAVSGGARGKFYLGMAKILEAECVLEKPFTPDELLAAINEASRRKVTCEV
jgi:two-component system, cell cycle response regulator CpdR